MLVGEKIKTLRTERNLTQKEFALKMGVSTGMVAEWESGDIEPSISEITKICTLFGVSSDSILLNDDLATSSTPCDVSFDCKSENNNRKTVKLKKILVTVLTVVSALIIATTVIVLFLTVFNKDRNVALENYSNAVEILEAKNEELDTLIRNAEKYILENHIALDESLEPALETAISEAKAARQDVLAKPFRSEDIVSATNTMNSSDYTAVINNLNSKYEAFEESVQQFQLVFNPTEAYVIQCLKKVPNVVDIAAATEENDTNGQLNKPGGYTVHVVFTSDLVNQNDVVGDSIIEKGTKAGGSIEVYATVEDAVARNEYLAAFDGGVLASGSHIVLGSLVVRTSDELTATQQKSIESNIVAVLTGNEDKLTEALPPLDVEEDQPAENTTGEGGGVSVQPQEPYVRSAVGVYKSIHSNNVLYIYGDGTFVNMVEFDLDDDGVPETVPTSGTWWQDEWTFWYNVNAEGWNNPFYDQMFDDGMFFMGEYYKIIG